jgi:hypothetical protein
MSTQPDERKPPVEADELTDDEIGELAVELFRSYDAEESSGDE